MADPYALELGIAFGMLPLAMIGPYMVYLFVWWWFKRTRPIGSFEIYDVGVYIINGVTVGVDEPLVPVKLRETHARWKRRLIDYDRRARLGVELPDQRTLRNELRVMEHQMRKEVVYFDRVCCLDVPDLVKAKVWGYL